MVSIKETSGSNGNGQHSLAVMMLMSTLGHGMLVETLKMAAFFIGNSSRTAFKSRVTQSRFREAEGCYFFVQGSGFQKAINKFGLDYDADILRSGFNHYIRRSD